MSSTQGARRGNLGVLTGALFVLLWIAGTVAQSMGADAAIEYPRPTDTMDKVQKWFEANGSAAEANAGLQILGGIALIVFAGAVAGFLRSVGRNGAASSVAALSGGLSAAMLLVGAAAMAGLGTDAASDAAVSQALYQVTFWTGGPLHVAALGLMVVATAAGLGGLMPKWLTVAGLVVGGLALLAALSGVAEPFVMFTLFGRYLSFVWIVIVSIMVGVRRSAPAGAPPAAAARA